MNTDIMKGKWSEVKGKVKAKWAKLTDEDLDYVSGRATQLTGILQKKYGYKKDEADKQVDSFMKTLH